MIPCYPAFKSLTLEDRQAVQTHTQRFPPYCDLEFGNLWSWDVKDEMRLSLLNGNLIVRFTDYATGCTFLTFLGTNDVNGTARVLLSNATGTQDRALHLIPDETARGLDTREFDVVPSVDHFDYLCELKRHLDYAGSALKSHRRRLRHFARDALKAEDIVLDLDAPGTRGEMETVCRRWAAKKRIPCTSEPRALERFLAASADIPHTAVGIEADGKLIAFHIASLPSGTCANALFSKADTAYRGIYAALDQAVARDLIARGYTHLNIQQDLGIENLRAAKLSLRPSMILQKYSVRLRA